MNDKDNEENLFFKSISCMIFSEPELKSEVNDDGEYKMEDKGNKNVKDDNNDNKIFFQSYKLNPIFLSCSFESSFFPNYKLNPK